MINYWVDRMPVNVIAIIRHNSINCFLQNVSEDVVECETDETYSFG